MSRRPTFRLVPIERLRPHEQVDPKRVRELWHRILRRGRFRNPIWVARGSWVILNGHHRVEALRKLGARRVPVWLFDYASDAITLGRWSPGPPISKSEVTRRAIAGRRFPIKTTRHRLAFKLPKRPTPLSKLLPPPELPPSPSARRTRPNRRGAGRQARRAPRRRAVPRRKR
jgi:L-serine kinase (ADP)